MIHRDKNNWISLCFSKFFLDITHCVTEIRDSIRQPVFEIVRCHNNDSNINMTVLEIVSDMHYVPCQQITPARNLDFYSEPGYNCLVKPNSFDPVNVSRLGLNPVVTFLEGSVGQLPDASSAVCLLLVEYKNLGRNENFLKFKKDVC